MCACVSIFHKHIEIKFNEPLKVALSFENIVSPANNLLSTLCVRMHFNWVSFRSNMESMHSNKINESKCGNSSSSIQKHFHFSHDDDTD